MTVTAPPRRRPRELDEIDQIEALIEEARRRTRRRRWRNAAIVVVTAAGVYVGLSARGGEGDGDGAGVVTKGPPPAVPTERLDRAALAAGRLTVIGVPLDAERANPVSHGWHQLAVVGGRGQIRPFLRCPDRRSYCGLVESLDWSPDGKRLAFTVGAHGFVNPFVGLHILDVRTGRDEHVIDSDVCTRVIRSDLAWSPDGSRLVYVCDRASGSGRTRALALFEPGFGVRELRTGVGGRISSPTWSPAGDRIAFAVAVAGAPPAIFSVRLDGSNRRVVVRDGSAPDWSRNGVIAYRSTCGGVKLVTRAGRDVTPPMGPFRCASIGVAGTPVWSPDGRELAISNRDGIYLVESDGSRLRRITTHIAIGAHGGRPSWRPSP